MEQKHSDEPLAFPFRAWCRRVGVSPSCAYEWARRGKLQITKFGKRSLITKAESERVLREGLR